MFASASKISWRICLKIRFVYVLLRFKNVKWFQDKKFICEKRFSKILGYDVQLNSEMISLYRMAKTTHSMLLFDMASGECGKWWRAQNNIENYETHNENFFISDSWLKKYVFIAVLNKKNINMDVFKHVFLEPWKIL
ncbi:MAG: C1 family peptidase [Roseburia faecis]|uniref:C1 family peptidase n=1 Tax=Roseburia faecis TaxID=301302 RepID=UPI0012E1D85E|nr:C1 family peptidase [Roseburia faecis]